MQFYFVNLIGGLGFTICSFSILFVNLLFNEAFAAKHEYEMCEVSKNIALHYNDKIFIDYVSVLENDEGTYSAWPTVAMASDGRLLLAYSGGRSSHVDPFGRLVFRYSDDMGCTWSSEKTIFDSLLDERDGGILELSNGDYYATTFTSRKFMKIRPPGISLFGKESILRSKWKSHLEKILARSSALSVGSLGFYSLNRGNSWNGPIDTLVHSPHGPVQLSGGRLLHVGRSIKGRPGVSVSVDNGRSWSLVGEIVARKNENVNKYYEFTTIECTSDRVVTQIRNHNSKSFGSVLQMYSEDLGKSWSVPRDTGLRGFPNHLLKLGDGSLLTTYSNRISGDIFVSKSSDCGETWGQKISLLSKIDTKDFGYPSTVVLDDDLYLTSWYQFDLISGESNIKNVRWGFK